MSQPTDNPSPTRSWLSFSTAINVLNVSAWYIANPHKLPGDCYAVYDQIIKQKAAQLSPPAATASDLAPRVVANASPAAEHPAVPVPAHPLAPDAKPPAALALPVVPNTSPAAEHPAVPAPGQPLALDAKPPAALVLPVVPNTSPPDAPPGRTELQIVENAPQVNRSPSPLGQATQLSTADKLKDLGSRWFWGAVGFPYTLKSRLINRISNSAKAAITEALVTEGVGRLITPEPNTPLKNLRDCLHALSAKISAKIEISEELRSQTAAAIDDFLSNQKKYLEEAPDPQTGFRTTLFKHEEIKFRELSKFLKENRPLAGEGPFVKAIYQLIETRWGYQQQFYVKKTARGLLSKTPTSSSPAMSAANKSANIEKSRFFETLYSPLTKPVESKKPIIGICEEIEKLKSLGFKILLAFFILPKNTFHKSDENNGGLLAGLIKKSENAIEVKDSNQIFQDLLFTELDNSELNFIQKTGRKLFCWVLARPLLFFLNHVFERAKNEILYLISLTTNERIKYINKILIEPGYAFINMLLTSYIRIAKEKPLTTVEETISSTIAQIKVKNFTQKDLITMLVSTLIDRYVPSINWAHTSAEHFDDRAKQTNSISKIWYYSWAWLSRGIDFAVAPLRWCIQKILRAVLKWTAASAIHSFLQDSNKSPQDFGKLALRSIYKTLLDKLELKNRTNPAPKNDSAKTSSALRQTVFVEKSIENQISQLVSSFLKVLYFQGSDVDDLIRKVSPANNVEQSIRAIMGFAYVPLVQIATDKIVEELQVFLEEESFSTVIFQVLADLEKQCLNFNSNTTRKGQIPLEQAFYRELQGAVKSGIKEGIDEKLDPSKRFQFEADLFVEGLKNDILDFKAKFDADLTLNPSHIRYLEQTRKDILFDIFLRRYERAENSTNPSAMLHINAYQEKFFDLRKPISEGINDLVKLASEKDKIQEAIAELQQLNDFISKATFPYKNLPVTLQKIRNKTYPDLIQVSLTRLQRALDSFTSERLKQENEAYLKGIVETLKGLLKESLDQYAYEDNGITTKIQKKHEEIQEKVDSLADWAQKNLNCFTCLVEAQQLDAFKQFLAQYGGSIQGGLTPLILKQLEAFFLILGKDHNIKGLLWYVLSASLDISINTEEFNKAVVKIKANNLSP